MEKLTLAATLLPILAYHHVVVKTEPFGHRRLWVSVDRLTEYVAFLVQQGYHCVRLRDCTAFRMGNAVLPP